MNHDLQELVVGAKDGMQDLGTWNTGGGDRFGRYTLPALIVVKALLDLSGFIYQLLINRMKILV